MSASGPRMRASARGRTPIGPLSILFLFVFVFAVLLYVRPLLHLASINPRRALNDPYYYAANLNFLLKDTYIGRDFLEHWQWQTIDDPTHGQVNYTDLATALAQNLTYASHDKFVMRADYKNIVPSSARGRNSVRIQSNKAYESSITILDLEHMPEGCATWPAFWSLSQKGPWPTGGEIDIIEGVNLGDENLSSLHTLPNCTMPSRQMSGSSTSTNCDANVNFNQGCGVQYQSPKSYGAEFNNGRGGFYVMVRTDRSIRIWFWARDDPSIPPEIRDPLLRGLFGGISPDPSWGLPSAEFTFGHDCSYSGHFDAHAFVFDLTLCGDWAGTVYGTPPGSCPGNCVDYVNNYPAAFEKAYWEVNALYIYTPA